jgi:hypothetical protein
MKFLCSIILLIVSTSLFADDIVMVCVTDNDKKFEYIFKFKSESSKDSVFRRINEQWVNWCTKKESALLDEKSNTGWTGWKTTSFDFRLGKNTAECNRKYVGSGLWSDYVRNSLQKLDFQSVEAVVFNEVYDENGKLDGKLTINYSCNKQ